MAGTPTPISTQENALIQSAHAKAYAAANISDGETPDWIASRAATPPKKMRGSAKRSIKTAAVPTVLVKQSVQKRKLVGEEKQGQRMKGGDEEASESPAEQAAEQQDPALEMTEQKPVVKKHVVKKRAVPPKTPGAY